MNACPECRAGKCRNCDGTAWDLERDVPAVCECWTTHEPTKEEPCPT